MLFFSTAVLVSALLSASVSPVRSQRIVTGPDGRRTVCQNSCGRILCPQVICNFGDDPAFPCSCCPVCLKARGETCGGPNSGSGNCAEGPCVDQSGQPINVNQGRFTPEGSCLSGPMVSIFPGNPGGPSPCPSCAAVSCGIPRCSFGTEIDPVCGCCPVCLKGPGETCGGVKNQEGNCIRGLTCQGPPGVFSGSGRCVARGGIEPGRGPGRRPGRGPGRRPGRGPGRRPGRGPGRVPGRGLPRIRDAILRAYLPSFPPPPGRDFERPPQPGRMILPEICSRAFCLRVTCDGPPITPPGRCCPVCPDSPDCRGVACPACVGFTPPGKCCPDCTIPPLGIPGEIAVY